MILLVTYKNIKMVEGRGDEKLKEEREDGKKDHLSSSSSPSVNKKLPLP